MKTIILAGGYGTRISEESTVRPKPMVEIGGKPILWHIMQMYSHYGLNDFIIALGYKKEIIIDYFLNFSYYNSDLRIDLKEHSSKILKNGSPDWKITLVDTGADSMTGGRLKRVENYIDSDNFCLTYGDGVSDINIEHLVSFHKKHGKTATVAAVQPPGRFGILTIDTPTDEVIRFREKPEDESGFINGGFMVLDKRIFSYIDGDSTVFENVPMQRLARDRELVAFRHSGFWQCLDTLRDKHVLENYWKSSKPPWKVWS